MMYHALGARHECTKLTGTQVESCDPEFLRQLRGQVFFLCSAWVCMLTARSHEDALKLYNMHVKAAWPPLSRKLYGEKKG